MDFFYTPEINDKNYSFSKEESKHCIKVLRKKINDEIYLTDGKGNLYKSIITDNNSNNCKIEVIEKTKIKKDNYKIHIAINPTKNINRFEWFLEKVTELGIDEITPIICQNSERKKINLNRLNKIIISAMKQSLKTYLPKLNDLTQFSDFIKNNFEDLKFIAHCKKDKKTSLKNYIKPKKNILILIGPEGDFTQEEINIAERKKFISVNLGKERLRTETAGIIACHTINLINQ